MRYVPVLILLWFLSVSPVPVLAQVAAGETCSPNGVTVTTNSGGNGYWMICQSGTWQTVFSHNPAGIFTKLGNQTCTSGQVLKFNGTAWACAADAGITALPAYTGDVTKAAGGTVLTIAAGAVDPSHMSATGTKSSATFLRGDNTWAAPPGGGAVLPGTLCGLAVGGYNMGGCSGFVSLATCNGVNLGGASGGTCPAGYTKRTSAPDACVRTCTKD